MPECSGVEEGDGTRVAVGAEALRGVLQAANAMIAAATKRLIFAITPSDCRCYGEQVPG
jgi:hypothetical protein